MVPKKDGNLKNVQDFHQSNAKGQNDRYFVFDINDSIGGIVLAESTIFTTLELTSFFFFFMLALPRRASF
jgi:hypothetical protein